MLCERLLLNILNFLKSEFSQMRLVKPIAENVVVLNLEFLVLI